MNVGEAALELCLHYSAVAKPLMGYQHLSNYQYKAQHDEEKLTPFQPDPTQTPCLRKAKYLSVSKPDILLAPI